MVGIETLVELQGNLKTLDREGYFKLRQQIVENGFSFPIQVWFNEGVYKILDGHQRLRVVKQMIGEGWECPLLPVSVTFAETLEEAKLKLLGGASQFGYATDDSLAEYLFNMGIGKDGVLKELTTKIQIPNLDEMKFIKSHFEVENEEIPEEEEAQKAEDLRRPSEHVRMVQLFLNDENHEEFLTKSDFLAKSYGKDNLTDTVVEAIREAHKARDTD